MNHNVERPIETKGDDRLLRQDFVARLLGALIEPEGRATGLVLALAGPGGSGKSSILNMVGELAQARHPAAIVVTFNPWLANSRNGLIHAFFAEVTAALEASAKKPGCTHPEKLKGSAQTIFKYGKRVAPAGGGWFCDGGASAGALLPTSSTFPICSLMTPTRSRRRWPTATSNAAGPISKRSSSWRSRCRPSCRGKSDGSSIRV